MVAKPTNCFHHMGYVQLRSVLQVIIVLLFEYAHCPLPEAEIGSCMQATKVFGNMNFPDTFLELKVDIFRPHYTGRIMHSIIFQHLM
ncbi:hypothetical protein X943_001065 [Babesia divergens]|uniref:Uncharacterized protein n=1 Tax=Babesia divergens TaxID=32595 RepID=A0AAD9GHN8_BABDI|nr:hypothetical protein X943_001065 [Babesia divergens]